jgi:hypothetical protein
MSNQGSDGAEPCSPQPADASDLSAAGLGSVAIARLTARIRRVRRGVAAVAAALVGVALFAPVASGDPTTALRLAPMASSMTLAGRAPVSTIDIPLPHDWSAFSGVLHLRWQASPEVTPNSTLRISVNGRLAAATGVTAGPGGIDVTLSRQSAATGRVQVVISGQLHTRFDVQCCIADPATAAVVRLDANASNLTVTGTRQAGEPLLASLPGSLVDTLGSGVTPLQLALPDQPSADAIRAAAVIAGAVARASGAATIPIRVTYGVAGPALSALPGQVVEVLPQGSPGAAISRRPDGRLILRLSGAGDGVVRAAWALARPHAAYLPGSSATITSGLPVASRVPSPSRTRSATLTPISVSGTGAFRASAVFRLPESQELTNAKAHLDLETGFVAPAGGSVNVALNGLALATLKLHGQGSSQTSLGIDLALETPVDATAGRTTLALLYPGENVITLSGDLPAGQVVGGSGDAQAPAFQVLPSSAVQFTSRPRTSPPTLELWPWPFSTTNAMAATTFVLPATPTPNELDWIIKTIDEASRWLGTALAPQIALAPPTLPAGDVVVLARGTQAPVALPTGSRAAPQPGLLSTYSAGGRQVLVAYGVGALRPLAYLYYPGKVFGDAAVVDASGATRTVVSAPLVSAFAIQPLPWKEPVAVLLLVGLAWFLWRRRQARRVAADAPDDPQPDPTRARLAPERPVLVGQGVGPGGSADRKPPQDDAGGRR